MERHGQSNTQQYKLRYIVTAMIFTLIVAISNCGVSTFGCNISNAVIGSIAFCCFVVACKVYQASLQEIRPHRFLKKRNASYGVQPDFDRTLRAPEDELVYCTQGDERRVFR
jgi:hypothetical protein